MPTPSRSAGPRSSTGSTGWCSPAASRRRSRALLRRVRAAASRCASGSRDGLPVYGSCAGMILLADDGPRHAARTTRASAGSTSWCAATRSAARSTRSRPTSTSTGIEGDPVRAVFIRAPWVESVGAGGRGARARVDQRVRPPVGSSPSVRAPLLATSFHPELTGDLRVHRFFVDLVRESDGPHERPLQVGDHQAQEGRRRRQAQQAVREADQEHRGRGTHRRR